MVRILVAEDDPDVRELVQLTMQTAGFEVDAVADGSTALEHALADPPDLCLVDVMMPGLDGLQLCAALRRDPATASAPIILLTAKAQESDIGVGLASGADQYVVKPFSPRGLIDSVRTLLGAAAGQP